MPTDSRGPARLAAAGRGVLGAIVALAMFGMMAVTFIDVVGRYLFSRPLPGSSELVQVLMAAMIGAALPIVTGAREHVSMDLLSGLFRGAARRALEVAIDLFSTAVLAFLAMRLWDQAVNLQRAKAGTLYLDVPIAPVAYALAALLGVAAITQLAMLFLPRAGTAPE